MSLMNLRPLEGGRGRRETSTPKRGERGAAGGRFVSIQTGLAVQLREDRLKDSRG